MTVDTPRALSASERQRASRAARRPDIVKFLGRPFRAIDGEGINLPDGSHIYTLLSSAEDGEEPVTLADPRGLRTGECLEYLLTHMATGAINVVYGGGYDFNMWLGDLTENELRRAYTLKYAYWRNYRISWRRGKSFAVKRVDRDGKAYGPSVLVYDCISFFQRPFLTACDEYFGPDWPGRDIVVAGKTGRSRFTVADSAKILEYNRVELHTLVRLMNDLRSRLAKIDLKPSRWDGPGAIAASLMRREGVKAHMTPTPEPVARAARYAYAGGRFEVIKFGHVERRAYEYDVNSAYPAALRSVPSIALGRWKWTEGREAAGSHPFALYHVSYEGRFSTLPGAFFKRAPNGTITYPMRVTGWYWSPEYEAGKAYCHAGYGTLKVLGRWAYEGPSVRPFSFIDALYQERRALKSRGDGAHIGAKLALNSLYGKTAQRVGAEFRNGTFRLPPYHQIEYAGYTTSWCRARVLSAVLPKIDDVIAFETDAVFTRTPLKVPITSELGDFEETRFSDLTYLQSGMYFGDTGGGVKRSGSDIAKTRGIDRGSLSRDDVLTKLKLPSAADRYVESSLTRFVGAGVALQQDFSKWRRWIALHKRTALEPLGKRIHGDCNCSMRSGLTLGRWHSTICPIDTMEHSAEYPIPWINPNPDMTELEDLTASERDYEREMV